MTMKTTSRPTRQESTVSGLRTRYTPRTRINQGLIGIGPWVDLILLVIMFVLFNGTMVLRPGVVIDLPRGPFQDGTQSGMLAVVLTVGTGSEPAAEVVFFDDERFEVDQPADREKLEQGFARHLQFHPDDGLVIQADASVSHGTILSLVDMASQVGVGEVNLALQTE